MLLPGAGATSAVWFLQVRELGRHFNLGLVELPGHRRRNPPPPGQPSRYSFPQLADDLDASVAAAGIERCHVVALSLGTILARVWSARHPNRVRSMVLAGTVADLPLIARWLMRFGWYARRVLPYMALYRIYAWTIMPGRVHRRTREMFYQQARMLGRREFSRWFDLAAETTGLLRELEARKGIVPVLHVMGSRDHMFRPGTVVLGRATGARVELIEGVGHACSVEAPDRFNTIALQFLESLQERRFQRDI